MTDLPAVCTLIPVWNDQDGIERTLEQLASDPYPYDIVIVDDGSETPIQCDHVYGIHRVRLIRLESNRGIEHALNEGLKVALAAGYRYVARLDAGDTPMEGRMQRQVAFLDQHPDVGIVGTWAKCVDDKGNYLFTLRFPTEHEAMLKKQRYIPALLHPSVMIRAEVFRTVGLYSDRYKTAEDYDLWVRIGERYRLANLPMVLTEYVISAKGTTISKRRKNLISRLRVQRDNFAWSDPHSYLGVARTLLFLLLPFHWLLAVKSVVWK